MYKRIPNPKSVPSRRASEQRPSFWKYEKGNDLEGRIIAFDSFEHNLYGMQNTVIVQHDSGKLYSAFLNPYLKTGMQLQNAEVNDRVKIQFQGQERSSSGHSFNKFRLEVTKNY